MPFPVSISFSSNSFSLRTSPEMAQPSSSQQNRGRNPNIPSRIKRARPRGLWKARGSVARPSAPTFAPPLTPLVRRLAASSDSERDSYLVDTPHARQPVTKHQPQQHHPQDYFSAIPQPDTSSDDDDDPSNWITRTKVMDISTTAGPGDPSPSDSNFSYEDWLDLKQLFSKACEQYEFDDSAETLPLLRGVIHECHRCLLAFHDPSILFIPIAETNLLQQQSRTPGSIGLSTRRIRGLPTNPVDLPTSFHTLLGITLFFFGNCIASNPELALPGEPSNPVPYWIAALDVFESGENIPNRIDSHTSASTYGSDLLSGNRTPPREDWRMAIMWGRSLVALATEMVDRHRAEPPPPAEPQHFSSPFPINRDYMKTGTIWDDEPEWPPESPFGVIVGRRPAITRRMSLNNATPHEILQIAMDHFSRGIFRMPHSNSVTPAYPSPVQPMTPQFTRTKALYEIADEVLLLAEKLDDPDERKEWATYADSVFAQIHVSLPHKYQVNTSALASSSKDTGEARSTIGDGVVAKARGRAWLVIGSTIAEGIEEKMDQGSDTEVIGSLMQSEEAQEARDALVRAIEFFERAKSYIGEDTWVDEEETNEEDNEDDMMAVDEEDDADDEQEAVTPLSARARGKQRRDPEMEEARRASRLEAKRASRAEAHQLRQQEVEEERKQLSHLLAEALCSLANLTENKEQQEEYYRRAEAETGVKLFDNADESMDEDR